MTDESGKSALPIWRRWLWPREFAKRLALIVGLLALLLFWTWSCMISMPGSSARGTLPALSDSDRVVGAALRHDVETIARERNLYNYEALVETAAYIENELKNAGCSVRRSGYTVNGKTCDNIIAEIGGGANAGEIIIVGAHYDSVLGSPGANDNASGVAALLSLARAFSGRRQARTLRFVAFVNEEPPYFQKADMGSWVYAKECRNKNETIVAMLSLETMGYYSDNEGTQRYPPPLGWFYPSTGNFIAFAGNISSGVLVRQIVGIFRAKAQFPSEGTSLPDWFPGVGWSDHWSFWQEGYRAVMTIDTAPFRYPHYHTEEDTPDKLDFDRLARAVEGLKSVVADMANPPAAVEK